MKEADGISRRGFLAAAGVGVLAAGLSGCAPSGKSASIASEAGLYPQYDIPGRLSLAEFEQSDAVAEPIESFDSEETYDVVIIGAGVGGIPAALSAAEAGASVCLLQKESCAVGQGSGCARIDRDTTDELAMAHLAHSIRDYCHLRSNVKLNEVWVNNCTDAIVWYAEKCVEAGMEEGVDFSSKPIGAFEYPEGNANTIMYDFKGGMNSPCVALAERFGEDVNIHYSCPGIQLIKEGERVAGVYAKAKDGSIIRVNANKGVIIATGDYQNNDAMVEKYVPDAACFERKQQKKTGDGHLMGLMAGAKMQNAGHTKMCHAKNWGANATVLKSSPFLAANMNGERFTAEDITMYYRNNAVKNQPDNVWLTIMDSSYQEQAKAMGKDNAIPAPDELDKIGEEGGIYKADTIAALAEKLGVPSDALVATVDRYNDLCEKGDLDFGKPTEYMLPVKQPPFYGLHREYAISAITSGLEIDERARVLDANRDPIEGLFAIGNCSGPFYGSIDYPVEVAGMSVSRCITFGYVTGAYVAGL